MRYVHRTLNLYASYGTTRIPIPTTLAGGIIRISHGVVTASLSSKVRPRTKGVDHLDSPMDIRGKIHINQRLVHHHPWEALLKEYMQKNDALLQTQALSIRNLELQIGQIAGELKTRQKGFLPSNTEAPLGTGSSRKEQCQAANASLSTAVKKEEK